MSNRFKLMVILFGVAGFVLLLVIFNDIRRSYIELGAIKSELSHVSAEFIQYQSLVQKVQDIDSKFTQELTYAKAENSKLYHNVIDGLGRLQLNINQTNQQASTSSMADGSTCELIGEARQNYYLLRDDIISKDTMILALQAYVNNVCLTD